MWVNQSLEEFEMDNWDFTCLFNWDSTSLEKWVIWFEIDNYTSKGLIRDNNLRQQFESCASTSRLNVLQKWFNQQTLGIRSRIMMIFLARIPSTGDPQNNKVC